MKLNEVLKPLVKQKLMEGQADRLVDDAMLSIRKNFSRMRDELSDDYVSFENNILSPIYERWKKTKNSMNRMGFPNTWKIMVAKFMVSTIFVVLRNRIDIGQAFPTLGLSEYEEEKQWLYKQAEKKNNKLRYDQSSHVIWELIQVEEVVHRLAHFLGIQYEPIQNFNPLTKNYNTMKDFIVDLEDLEEEYQDSKRKVDRYLVPTGQEEVVIDFPDNFFWVHLNVMTCEKEASAMQHCGNAESNDGDTILSLREIKTKDPNDPTLATLKDGVTYHYPYLTFILNDGLLGEMKGFKNQKPSHRYHPYIVELLKHPMIKGIIGHGYLAENNFELGDLNEAQLEEIRQVKGDEFINREGDMTQKHDLFFEKMREKYTSSDDHLSLSWPHIDKFNEILDDENLDVGEMNNDGTVYVRESDAWKHWSKVAKGNDIGNFDPGSIDNYRYFVDDYLPTEAQDAIVRFIRNKQEAIRSFFEADAEDEDDLNQIIGVDDNILGNLDEILVWDSEFSVVEDALNYLYFSGTMSGTEGEIYEAIQSGLTDLTTQYYLEDISVFEFFDKYSESIPVKPAMLREYFNALLDDPDKFVLDVGEPQYGFMGFDEKVIQENWIDVFTDNNIIRSDDE